MFSPCKEIIERWGREAGIDRMGFVGIGAVDSAMDAVYSAWLAGGNAGTMDYLARYRDERRNPELLLTGARTIITCAISYWHPEVQASGAPRIAMYAHGDDYHDVVRKILSAVAERITTEWGGECRVCVDTAPIHERYWAIKSGLGFSGRNGLLIIPGIGSYCFLGEILCTHELAPGSDTRVDDWTVSQGCAGCNRCVEACPGHALKGDGTMDCTMCLSYLTIEYREDFPSGFTTGGRLAGCDTCQQVCPHNRRPLPTGHPEFLLRPTLRDITREQLSRLTPETYAALFRRSSLKRLKLSGILRNIRHL